MMFSACGGGGGGSASPGVPPPTMLPTTGPPSTTSASGRVVDDPSGSPLGGIKVGLAPWTPGATPMPVGTTAPDGTFLFTAPNGHYLLVIGSELPSDTTRPTIHDNVTLSGGVQALKAPVLPAIPLVTPPPAETGGNYRLTTINATTELPCFTAFNTQRASYSVAPVIEDEWLTENTREWNQARQDPRYTAGMTVPGTPFGGFLSTSNVASGGGVDCPSSTVAGAFTYNVSGYAMYNAKNPLMLWFGGNFLTYTATASSAGLIEYPQDPRAYLDPNVGAWP